MPHDTRLSPRTLAVLRDAAASDRATAREQFLLSVALEMSVPNRLVHLEAARLAQGGKADYLPLLSDEVRERWLHAMAGNLDGLPDPPSRPGSFTFQFLGSHNPYHVGHRIMIYSLLKAGHLADGQAVVTTMGVNEHKSLTLDSYAKRHTKVERALARDPLRRIATINALDLPTGTGISRNPLLQSALIALLSGDEIRVVMGSDKLEFDAKSFEQSDRYVYQKYADADRHFFVVPRQGIDPADVIRSVHRFPTTIQRRIGVLPQVTYEPGPSSSRLIRTLQQGGESDRLLAEVLTDGVPQNLGQHFGPSTMQDILAIDLAADQSLTDHDSVGWRYEREHGCIGPIVTGNDCLP